jgi:hypothetical protein
MFKIEELATDPAFYRRFGASSGEFAPDCNVPAWSAGQ